MTRVLLGAALCLALGVAAPLAAEDWPRFRGPAGSGSSPSTRLATEWSAERNVLYSRRIPCGCAGSSLEI
jgi:hypothetical protein